MDVKVKSPDFSNDILFCHDYKCLHLGDRNSQEDELKKRKARLFFTFTLLVTQFKEISSRKKKYLTEAGTYSQLPTQPIFF